MPSGADFRRIRSGGFLWYFGGDLVGISYDFSGDIISGISHGLRDVHPLKYEIMSYSF